MEQTPPRRVTVNVRMQEETRRTLKGEASAAGLTESELLIGSWKLVRAYFNRGLVRDIQGDPVRLAAGLQLIEDEEIIGRFPKRNELDGRDFSLQQEIEDVERLGARLREQANDRVVSSLFRKRALERLALTLGEEDVR